MTCAVKLEKISFSHFEQKIINNIDLEIQPGEFVVLVGPNGSGKSTLLKLINGSVGLQTGSIQVKGHNIGGKSLHYIAQFVSTLTQDLNNSTFSDLTVLENMQLACHRKSPTQTAIKVDNAEELSQYLSKFNSILADKLSLSASRLSGGQRQALALAMGFLHTPQLLLLDEHTSALDPKAAQNIMALTNEHILKNKLTTIMVTHNLDDALQYGTRIIALDHGRVSIDIVKEDNSPINRHYLLELVYDR